MKALPETAHVASGTKRLDNPHQYPAGLELTLPELNTKLIPRGKGDL